jgi:hypothetical protein
LLLVTGLARILLVAGLALLSAGVVAAGDPTALPVAGVAGVLLMIAAVTAVRMAWRRVRTVWPTSISRLSPVQNLRTTSLSSTEM